MSSNKQKREELEKIYGKGSMFEKSQCEQYVETLPRIKGYQKYIEEKRYTTKEKRRLTKNINFHHLIHKSEGGETSIENGALVNEMEHRYMHSLPRQEEEIINDHIRQWKIDFITLTTEGVIESGEVVPEIETITIPVYTYKRSRQATIERQRRHDKRKMQKIKKELEDR